MPCSSGAAAAGHLRSPFLDGLAAADLNVILAAATPRRLLARSIVANQGSPADSLFLLTEGRARFFFITEDGIKRIGLRWLSPGDIFGAMAASARHDSYLVSTEMVRDGCVLAWNSETIRNLAGKFPRLWQNALAVASDYLAFYAATRIALTCSDVRERLAYVLVTLERSIGDKDPGGVALHITNEELADVANVTVFTVSRLLSEWQRQGAIVKSRGKILLRSPERLLQFAA